MFDIVGVISAIAPPSVDDRDEYMMDESISGSGSVATNSSGSGSRSESGFGMGHELGVSTIPPEFSNLSIALPAAAFDEAGDQNETGIVLSFYYIPSLFPVMDGDNVVGSPVVAASIAGREVSNLSDPVVITLSKLAGSVSR